jgi:hypothetical protein
MCPIHGFNVAVLNVSHHNYVIVHRMAADSKPTDDRLSPNSQFPRRSIGSDLATVLATIVSGCLGLFNFLRRDCRFLVVVLLVFVPAFLQPTLLQHGPANSACNFRVSIMRYHGVFVLVDQHVIELPVLAAESLIYGLGLSCDFVLV